MKQRNALLKQRSLQTIAIWEEHMAHAAVFLTQTRSQSVAELAHLSRAETLGADQLELAYRSTALTSKERDLKNYFLKQFEKHRSRECDLGISLSGPHRDDLSIILHGKEARCFASEGQQRSCALALKLSQWKWLKTLTNQTPMFCIDDLGVSFDTHRENALYTRLETLGQVFVTSAHPPTLTCHLIQLRMVLRALVEYYARYAQGRARNRNGIGRDLALRKTQEENGRNNRNDG